MADDLSILFCLTCSSDLEPPQVRTHQAQEHIVVRVAIADDEAEPEGEE